MTGDVKMTGVACGTIYNIPLWDFVCEIVDRRNGEHGVSGIIVVGNEEYDMDAAIREVTEKYGYLGYSVVTCTFKDERVFKFDALELYAAGDKTSRTETTPNSGKTVTGEEGETADAVELAFEELEDGEE